MQLNRKQRRFFNRQSPESKRLQDASFMSPDKVDRRLSNFENGKAQHAEFVRQAQEALMESLANSEASIMERLKALKLSKQDSDNYMDVWSGCNMWPKPEDSRSLKKELKSLNKEYNING